MNTMEKITKLQDERLADFDPKQMYPAYEGMEVVSKKTRQIKLGGIYKLIKNMYENGAASDELERAIKHFIVVMESVKHNLNYKQSYLDCGIADLKKKYQINTNLKNKEKVEI